MLTRLVRAPGSGLGGQRLPRETRAALGWGSFTAAVVVSLLVLPFADGLAQELRVDVCRGQGSCGYQAPRTRCALLSRDVSMAASLVPFDQIVDARRQVEVTTTVDGVTVVRLPGDDRPAAVSGHDGSEEAPPPMTTAVAAAVQVQAFRFDGPDEARGWRERRAHRYRPIHGAAVGGGKGSGDTAVAALLQAWGFRGPDGGEVPYEVEVRTGRQLMAGTYLRVSGPTVPSHDDPVWTGVGADGSTTSSGRLAAATSLADAEGSLAGRLGMLGDATYTVLTDRKRAPRLLILRGEAQQRGDGTFQASSSLVRLHDSGTARGPGTTTAERQREEGRHVVQTVALDLRTEANLAAFRDVFVSTGTVTVPRSPTPFIMSRSGRVAVDLEGRQTRVGHLVDRLAQDGVYVRERSRTTAVGAGGAGGTTIRETTLIDAYSQDFAVPASGLTRLPGCSR